MSYFIKFITKIFDSECSVTIRGLFNDGRYYGDVVVQKYKLIFTFENNISSLSMLNKIFDCISFFIKLKQSELNKEVDCWIGYYPIQHQSIIFKHYKHEKYEGDCSKMYDCFIRCLKNELDEFIIKKIHEKVKSQE